MYTAKDLAPLVQQFADDNPVLDKIISRSLDAENCSAAELIEFALEAKLTLPQFMRALSASSITMIALYQPTNQQHQLLRALLLLLHSFSFGFAVSAITPELLADQYVVAATLASDLSEALPQLAPSIPTVLDIYTQASLISKQEASTARYHNDDGEFRVQMQTTQLGMKLARPDGKMELYNEINSLTPRYLQQAISDSELSSALEMLAADKKGLELILKLPADSLRVIGQFIIAHYYPYDDTIYNELFDQYRTDKRSALFGSKHRTLLRPIVTAYASTHDDPIVHLFASYFADGAQSMAHYSSSLILMLFLEQDISDYVFRLGYGYLCKLFPTLAVVLSQWLSSSSSYFAELLKQSRHDLNIMLSTIIPFIFQPQLFSDLRDLFYDNPTVAATISDAASSLVVVQAKKDRRDFQSTSRLCLRAFASYLGDMYSSPYLKL